jgi:hypothetical protein
LDTGIIYMAANQYLQIGFWHASGSLSLDMSTTGAHATFEKII